MSDGTGSVARIRSRRGAMGLALVLVFAGCTGSSDPSGTPVASDEAQAPVVQPTPASDPFPTPPGSVRVGLIGLPPRGAEPSRPETGELLMRFGSGNTFIGSGNMFGSGDTFGCGWCSWSVYADGRFVWQHQSGRLETIGGHIPAYLEQRLTPEGVELVRGEILSSPHMRQRPGRWYAHYQWFSVEVLDGDRVSSVSWGIGRRAHPGLPAQGALRELLTRMSHLELWLPTPAWAETRIRAFVPSRYFVSGDVHPRALPPPADSLLRSRRCQLVSMDGARALVTAFDAAGLERTAASPDPTLLEFVYERNRGVGYLSFEPALPHQTSC